MLLQGPPQKSAKLAEAEMETQRFRPYHFHVFSPNSSISLDRFEQKVWNGVYRNSPKSAQLAWAGKASQRVWPDHLYVSSPNLLTQHHSEQNT